MFPLEKFPFSNFHDLNLDWVLRKVQEFIGVATTAIQDAEDAKDSARTSALSAEQAENAASTAQNHAKSAENSSRASQVAAEAAQAAAEAAQEMQIPEKTITTNKLADGAVDGTKIAAGAVTTDKIANGAVNTAKIAAGAVATSNIATGAVSTVKISAGAVTTDKIANGAVRYDKLGDDTKPILLWENASPTSEFKQQTISLNLTAYTRIIIIYLADPSASTPAYGVYTISTDNTRYNIINLNNSGAIITRTARATTSGVTFSAGITYDTYRTESFTNNILIPTKIYGIK